MQTIQNQVLNGYIYGERQGFHEFFQYTPLYLLLPREAFFQRRSNSSRMRKYIGCCAMASLKRIVYTHHFKRIVILNSILDERQHDADQQMDQLLSDLVQVGSHLLFGYFTIPS